jgi:hypothetical protein
MKEPEAFPIIPHIAKLLAAHVEKSSLREVAAEVGVSHGTIHRVINGAAPDVFTFLKLVNHFGLVAGTAFESPAHLSLEKWEKPSECRELLISFFTPWQRVAFEKAIHALMDGGGWIQCYSTGEYLRFEVAAEELECVKMYLDKLGIPKEKDGQKLSYVGRIQALVESVKNSGKTSQD